MGVNGERKGIMGKDFRALTLRRDLIVVSVPTTSGN